MNNQDNEEKLKSAVRSAYQRRDQSFETPSFHRTFTAAKQSLESEAEELRFWRRSFVPVSAAAVIALLVVFSWQPHRDLRNELTWNDLGQLKVQLQVPSDALLAAEQKNGFSDFIFPEFDIVPVEAYSSFESDYLL